MTGLVTLTASPITGITTSQAEQWFSGSGAPSSGSGVQGDWYLDSVSGNFYEKTSNTVWTLRGNLQGPAGAPGATGPAGTVTVYEQTGDPGAVAVGSIWLDTDAVVQTIYVSGAGKTTVSDADLGAGVAAVNGMMLIHYDSTASRTYLSVRSNGTWHVMAGPVV